MQAGGNDPGRLEFLEQRLALVGVEGQVPGPVWRGDATRAQGRVAGRRFVAEGGLVHGSIFDSHLGTLHRETRNFRVRESGRPV